MLPIALDPILDLAEQHLHEDGLRAYPSTEKPAENYREQDDEHHHGDHRKPEEIEILWPEDLAEDDELPFKDVEHQ